MRCETIHNVFYLDRAGHYFNITVYPFSLETYVVSLTQFCILMVQMEKFKGYLKFS